MVGGRRFGMKIAAVLPAFLSVTRHGAFSLMTSGRRFAGPYYNNYPIRSFLTGALSSQASPNYFLLKSEPEEFSIQDLQICQEEEWDGVRNFQARNKLRLMKEGDLAFFYHSSCKVPAVVGVMSVAREVAPDATALDLNHKGYDAKSTPENCRWDAVRVRFESIFDTPVTLKQLKELSKDDEVIASMTLLRQSRLSVHEVTNDQWVKILAMADQKEEEHESEVEVDVETPPKKKKRKSSS